MRRETSQTAEADHRREAREEQAGKDEEQHKLRQPDKIKIENDENAATIRQLQRQLRHARMTIADLQRQRQRQRQHRLQHQNERKPEQREPDQEHEAEGGVEEDEEGEEHGVREHHDEHEQNDTVIAAVGQNTLGTSWQPRDFVVY